MNPLEIMTKLIENPRTSGGAIVAAGGFWLFNGYGTGPEGDMTAKYLGMALFTIGLLLIGFGASDAKNTVLKSEVEKLPDNKPITKTDLTQTQPTPPIRVELVDDEGKSVG